MEVNINKTEDKTIIIIIGRLDTPNSSIFEKQTNPVLDSDMKNVIIDCKSLEYICSSGLRLFLSMQKAANAKKGLITIINMNEEIKSVFDMTGFTSLFNIQ